MLFFSFSKADSYGRQERAKKRKNYLLFSSSPKKGLLVARKKSEKERASSFCLEKLAKKGLLLWVRERRTKDNFTNFPVTNLSSLARSPQGAFFGAEKEQKRREQVVFSRAVFSGTIRIGLNHHKNQSKFGRKYIYTVIIILKIAPCDDEGFWYG